MVNTELLAMVLLGANIGIFKANRLFYADVDWFWHSGKTEAAV